MKLVHHHMLYYSEVGEERSKAELENMLVELVEKLDMQILIQPKVVLSHLQAWTGFVGIVTSHISFHYWLEEKYVQMDIYSCKSFDKDTARTYLNKFWNAKNDEAIFIDRDKQFEISKL